MYLSTYIIVIVVIIVVIVGVVGNVDQELCHQRSHRHEIHHIEPTTPIAITRGWGHSSLKQCWRIKHLFCLGLKLLCSSVSKGKCNCYNYLLTSERYFHQCFTMWQRINTYVCTIPPICCTVPAPWLTADIIVLRPLFWRNFTSKIKSNISIFFKGAVISWERLPWYVKF